tara:strand:+ start:863 stop:1192 length:330 start_codon:yes stop_codon:yes gene_type:complete
MSYSQRVVEWQKGYDGLSYSPGKPSSHKVIGRKVIAYPTTGHLWRDYLEWLESLEDRFDRDDDTIDGIHWKAFKALVIRVGEWDIGLKLKFIKDSYLEYVKNEKRIREI